MNKHEHLYNTNILPKILVFVSDLQGAMVALRIEFKFCNLIPSFFQTIFENIDVFCHHNILRKGVPVLDDSVT